MQFVAVHQKRVLIKATLERHGGVHSPLVNTCLTTSPIEQLSDQPYTLVRLPHVRTPIPCTARVGTNCCCCCCCCFRIDYLCFSVTSPPNCWILICCDVTAQQVSEFLFWLRAFYPALASSRWDIISL